MDRLIRCLFSESNQRKHPRDDADRKGGHKGHPHPKNENVWPSFNVGRHSLTISGTHPAVKDRRRQRDTNDHPQIPSEGIQAAGNAQVFLLHTAHDDRVVR